MASWQWFGRVHRGLYRATHGRIGARLAGLPMLLLTTTGRRSGDPRTTPLSFMPDGDDFVVVGSNNGGPRDPAWWLNLQQRPEAEIQVGRDRFAVRAERATGAERERLWPRLKEFNRAYRRYEAKTRREIPVVKLRKIAGSPADA
jgi:deazaflavin-dependent oxidoreductase (nitroreductase family)